MTAMPDLRAFAATGPTILHPTDFSPGDAPALGHSVALALKTHGRLTLLHIRGVDEAGPTRNGLAPISDMLVRWGRLAPEERFAEFRSRLGFAAACLDLPARSVTAGVLEHFADHVIDLAVLTTRDHSGINHWLTGSTSRRALRQASAMILFLREGKRGFIDPVTGEIRLKRVLIPLDGRIPPAGPIARAKALIEQIGQSVEYRAVHIGTAPPPDCPKDMPLILAQGPVAPAILKAAHDCRADLIVMPTAGKRGVLAAFRNSVTAEILDDARWPVLSVPAV